VIFKQGDSSGVFYVIIKGTVCINIVKEELGFIPFNSKIAYDGDYFGELAHFEKSETLKQEVVNELNKQRSTCMAMEECYVLEIDKVVSNMIINKGL
jgi:CRP-like cAMP-binding protein